MSFTFSSYQALLIPLVLILGYLGFKRGFWREVGITAGLALVVLATIIYPEQFIGFINRIIINIPRVFGLLLNADVNTIPEDALFGDPTSGRFLLARIAFFALLTFLVYGARFAWAYDPGGKPRGIKTTGEKVFGAVLGGISGFLWYVAINDFLNTWRELSNDPTLPLEGTTISVPTVGDISPLLAFVPTIVVVLLVVLLVLAALRLPNLWR